jgi:hypothetical protein
MYQFCIKVNRLMTVIVHTDDTMCSTVLQKESIRHKCILLEAGNLIYIFTYLRKYLPTYPPTHLPTYLLMYLINYLFVTPFALLSTYFVHMVFSFRKTFCCPGHYRNIQFTTASVIVNFVPLCSPYQCPILHQNTHRKW